MDYYNQRINCDVPQCKYFNERENKCTLGSITVGKNLKETYCKNFEEDELD